MSHQYRNRLEISSCTILEDENLEKKYIYETVYFNTRLGQKPELLFGNHLLFKLIIYQLEIW